MFFSVSVSAGAAELAIVVNISNPVDNLSLRDLIKIFKAERQFWGGKRIHILMHEEGSWEKEIILKKIYQMSGEELNKFWLGKVFRGEINNLPMIIGSANILQKIIRQAPEAIGFIDASNIGEGLKVLKL